jgi:hypothetical protein
MAITTMDGLVAALAGAQRLVFQKASITTVAAFYYSLWSAGGAPGAGTLTIGNTTTGLVPTDATAGAPIINAFTGANTGYLTTFDAMLAQPGVLSIYDRLFHVGSISAAAAATTTLGTQPSYSSRVPGSDWSQCELWLEINVVIPATAVTVTVSYQDGSNATQTATLDTSLTGAPSMRMLPFRLANATGIQKINSITVATPAASGSFNVVVQRNLVDHTIVSANIARPKKNPFDTGMPIVYADSCLAAMVLATATSSGVLFAEGTVANG